MPILAPTPEPRTKTVSTKVGTTTHTQVKTAAAKQSVSMAEYTRRALAAYLRTDTHG